MTAPRNVRSPVSLALANASSSRSAKRPRVSRSANPVFNAARFTAGGVLFFRLADWNVTCLIGGKMKSSRLRFAVASTALLASANLALAHPGHDGDHGLTWDFRHLVEHPAATALSALVLVGAAWGFAQVVGIVLSRRQS